MSELRSEREWSESIVLAAILENPSNFAVFELTADHFRVAQYRQVFTAIQHHIEHGFPVEPSALADTLGARKPGPWSEMFDLLAQVVITNAERSAEALRHSSDAELARGIARELIEDGDIEQAVQRLHALRMGHQSAVFDASTLRARLISSLDEREAPGLATGFKKLDSELGGLHDGDLVVIAARPAHGKTALMLNIAINCKAPVLIFSGEQPALQCEARILSAASLVSVSKMRNRDLDQIDIQRLTETSATLGRNYWISDKSAPSLADIVRTARQQQYQNGIKAVFVDYIQRMKRDPKKPKHEAVGDNVMGLKELARDLNIPVIALAQVNRGVESRDDKQPYMSDIKDSGEIEQEADVVMTLYRPKVYEPTSEDHSASLYIAKNRHGPVGQINLEYLEQFVRFQDAQPRYA